VFQLIQQKDDPEPTPCWMSVLFHQKEHGELTTPVDLYASSLHFSMTTLATVGYGDITPQVIFGLFAAKKTLKILSDHLYSPASNYPYHSKNLFKTFLSL
jgi:hypothetical protein